MTAKASPYGADIPSAIPRPARVVDDRVFAPRPGYGRLTPITGRAILPLMRGHLNAQEPKVVRWLHATWNAQQEAITYQALVGAVASGEVSMSWIAQWQQDYSRFVAEELDPRWRQAMSSAAGAAKAGLDAYAGQPFGFTPTGARIEAWIGLRGGELAVNLTQSQHQALRSILRYYTVDRPVSPAELGRIIRPVVGLTPKQAEAVRKFRENLVAEGLLQRQIDRQVGQYASWLHRVRAANIARTELAMSYNYGQLEAMRQAQDQGWFGGRPLVKVWIATQDDRTCYWCQALDGEQVGLEETYPGMTAPTPNIYTPPAHPGCRCSTGYSVSA